MSKRQVKSQASSSRAAFSAAGGGFGTSSPFGFTTSSSPLSYVTEPPDLSGISDPNVVVYFRNLQKKDSTTKAKALEDLQTYVSSLKDPVEEAVLEAWIKAFPRVSIDNARRVRQLCFVLHGQISTSAGKRVAKHMPKAVGPWLAGLYDTDRAAAKAAQDSLRRVFNSPEKLKSVRKAYQQHILQYCGDAMLNETALTLSDERTVNPDDAEAKYSRVVSACIAVIGSLMNDLRSEEVAKHQKDYDNLLGNDKLWAFASYNEPSVRRSMHRFLKTCISKHPDALEKNLEVVSKAYLANSLNSDQTGSAYDYADALAQLTTRFPTVWTSHYQSKTPVAKRLRQFLKRGSQSGPREFWSLVAHTIDSLPEGVIPSTGGDVAEILSSMHGGIIRKDEPRANLGSAWDAYLTTCGRLCNALPDKENRTVMTELILPILSQYIKPVTEGSEWTLPPNAGNIVHRAMIVEGMPEILEKEWARFAEGLIEDIKKSAPEQSKDFDKSQKALIDQGVKFARLQESVMSSNSSNTYQAVFAQASASVIVQALSVLKNRNGKPYGAAGIIAELLYHCKDLVFTESAVAEHLTCFVRDDLARLYLSPSSSQLADILFFFHDSPFFKDVWSEALRSVLRAPDSASRQTALGCLINSAKIPPTFDLASTDPELQEYIKSRAVAAINGEAQWDDFNSILQSSVKALSDDTSSEILSQMTEALSLSDQLSNALHGFHYVVKQNPSFLKAFLSTEDGSHLLAQLLSASESPSEGIAHAASSVYASVQALLATGSGSKQSLYDVIQNGLLNASDSSVSVETLVDLATELLKSSNHEEDVEKILPNMDEWNLALLPFLQVCPRRSLAFSNPLGGAIYLVQSDPGDQDLSKIPRDAEGYSPAFRIGQFLTKLFKDAAFLDRISTETKQALLQNIAITYQLADDNLGLSGANHLWADYNAETEADVIAFMDDAQTFITNKLKTLSSNWSDHTTRSHLLNWGMELLTQCPEVPSSPAYYLGRTFSVLIAQTIELRGWQTSSTSEMQDTLKTMRKSPNILVLISFLNAFREPLAASKSCERMCNELVADLTYSNIEQTQEKSFQQVVLLNAIIENQNGLGQTIAKPRLVSFMKHIVPWLHDVTVSLSMRAELCRTLTVLLPLMSDIYDSLWGEILNAISGVWSKPQVLKDDGDKDDTTIPFVHGSLKLYAQLRSLTTDEDPNDDLVDAWKDAEEATAEGLINLLKHTQHFPDEFHQPLRMVNDVLARQIAKIPLKYLEAAEDLYPLLYVDSQPVQQTAFNILHRQIPAAQEQISIDAAIEHTTARLPEELLSLILETPTMAALAEANFERSVPLPLRGYLLSWVLVFDHLEHASYKVKSDYVEHLKEGDYAPGLLAFMFDFLGHGKNKPVDVSKYDVTGYTPDLEPPKQDTQWLLAHLYFLCLRHIPSLTKSWWISCKSRSVAVSLEGWTERYISPPVISAALESVSEWATSQEQSDADSPFSVKVSHRAGEVTASYTVDEQTMTMRITLPPSFPLANVLVEGLNRVAVDEKKWQSWLRISQGAITFSNGNLVDGLTTFKKNVEGALKGQTECAICYSIIAPDKRVPDKKCSTCKNTFHGHCLFKWFRSSSSSSCPLCRNPFHYGYTVRAVGTISRAAAGS
jgi:hypothetical protein